MSAVMCTIDAPSTALPRDESRSMADVRVRRPSLAVLSLSESCAAIWPTLAAELGLLLCPVVGTTELAAIRDAVVILSLPGDERAIESTLATLDLAGLEIAVVGAIADHRVAVTAIRAGAAEYFALPGDSAQLRSWVEARASTVRSRIDRQMFATSEAAKYRFEGIVGRSEALQRALERAARIIPHDTATVLITGETGTGKELLARALHYNGPRRENPFVDINCAAIPEHLLESELFGHEKGAFTGATCAKPGLFEVANGGAVFLDEIGHLSMDLQGKLLRVLEDRSIRRVGGTVTKVVDIRVIAATHVDLEQAVRQGAFREDLWYRLNVLPIELPPLRYRAVDIPLLAEHFIARFAREYDLAEPVLTSETIAALTTHPWHGNIRELRNVMERAVLLTSGQLDVASLGLAARDPVPQRGDSALGFPTTLRDLEVAAALEMMRLCDGNKSEAARRLGISRTRLQRILDRAAGSPIDYRGDET